MKRLLPFIFSIAAFAMAISVFAAEYTVNVSVTGGSPQRLSTLLNNAGYSGTMTLDSLTTCNPDTNTVDLYRGQANVNSTNSLVLHPGDCFTDPPGAYAVDASQIYLRTSSTQPATVILRSR